MTVLVWLIAGIAAAGGFIAFARAAGPTAERPVLATGLPAAALVYVLFALDRAPLVWVAVEGGGFLLYAGMALLGMRRQSWWLVAGWGTHIGWDVGLHTLTGVSFVPAWYPVVCLTFDLVVAIWIAGRFQAGFLRRWSGT